MFKAHYLLLALLLAGMGGIYLTGESLTAPALRPIGNPPLDFPAESVVIRSSETGDIRGWFIAGKEDKPGILLLHSVRSDRREMLGRAEFLFEAGYSVLLIDMQAHGETPGNKITFGYKESADVHAALDFLRNRIKTGKVGLIGVSLGGAASLLGESPIHADAVILEAVYSSIERAVKNRLSIRLGDVGQLLAPLLIRQIKPTLGISPEKLSPLHAIERLKAPVMIIAGTEDRRTMLEESLLLFEKAHEPKQLWLVSGAKHQNLYAYTKQEYKKRVLQFFKHYLEAPNTNGATTH